MIQNSGGKVMEINKGMLGYFVFGINAIVDDSNSITTDEATTLIENKQLISKLKENYNDYWDWEVLDKYSEDIHQLLNDYLQYIESESYRKFGIKSNGFLIISSVLTQIIVNGDRE